MTNANSFFFYDLETSGVDPRKSRIMQFAGQRTDLDLRPIGEPYNLMIKLSDDVLPDPDAIMITGITPQKTLEEGITEAEFCKIFMTEIVQPNTCFLGFNTIRFDDEFMRFLLYRNYYDPYAWQWKDGCSRWDLLDVVRMTRALRPDGINWPKDKDGVPTNRLELLTKENGLNHEAAHDALSDVTATIAVAKLVKDNQPKLFDYLYSVRSKKQVADLILKGQPFVYSSGRYSNQYEKTSVAMSLGIHPTSQASLVYDLRHDPTQFINMSIDELVEAWKYTKDKDAVRLPVKAVQFNRSPAVAPLGVIDDDAWKRLDLDLTKIKEHMAIVKSDSGFYERLCKAVEKMNIERDKNIVRHAKSNQIVSSVEEKLYDAFIPGSDRLLSNKVIMAKPSEISQYTDKFQDERLKSMIPLYKARNYPNTLTDEDRIIWEDHRQKMLLSGGMSSAMARFGARLNDLSGTVTDPDKQYLLEELKLYAESIVPEP